MKLMALIVLTLISTAALAGDATGLVKPVPQIRPVKLGKLSHAYDWIENERIRAMYGYSGEWKNKQLMDDISKADLNTILVHFMGKAMSEQGCPQEVAEWARVQSERKIHVIVSWSYGADDRYGNGQFGLYNPGNSEVWKKTPCPLSSEYWNRVVGDRALICAQAGLTGMVVDMEMYGADQTVYPGPCYCDHCWGKFVDEYVGKPQLKKLTPDERSKWVSEHGLWQDYSRYQEIEMTSILKNIEQRVHAVNPNFILGNLLCPETVAGLTRGFGTPEMPALIFSELEYHGNTSSVSLVSHLLKKDGYPGLYVGGLGAWEIAPPRLDDLISRCSLVGAGYWIWSTGTLTGANSQFPVVKGFSNDDFWKALARANNNLTGRIKSGETVEAIRQSVPSVRVARVGGVPSEADWAKTPALGPFVLVYDGKAAKADTRARVLWDGTRLYVRFDCDEPHPEKMAPPSGERDSSRMWSQDSTEILWMRPGGDRMAHAIVNTSGAVTDLLRLGLHPDDLGWNADIKAQCAKTDKGWEATVSIPLDQDGGGKVKSGSRLCLELARNRRADGEASCWISTKGMYEAAPDRWGVITLE